MTKVIEFNYESIHTPKGLHEHCNMSDVDIRKVDHSKPKNYVTNLLYSTEELSDIEKLVFLFIYDLKAQQKYLPWIKVNQKKIAFILGVSESTVSRAFLNLIRYNLLIESENRFGEKIIIPNENINTWWVAIDSNKLSVLEELRKHIASSNRQLTEEYKSQMKEEVS